MLGTEIIVQNNIMHTRTKCPFLGRNFVKETFSNSLPYEKCACFIQNAPTDMYLNEGTLIALNSFKEDFRAGELNYANFYTFYSLTFKENLDEQVKNELESFVKEVKNFNVLKVQEAKLLANLLFFALHSHFRVGGRGLSFNEGLNFTLYPYTQTLVLNNLFADKDLIWLENSSVNRVCFSFLKDMLSLNKEFFGKKTFLSRGFEHDNVTFDFVLKMIDSLESVEKFEIFQKQWLQNFVNSDGKNLLVFKMKFLELFKFYVNKLNSKKESFKEVIVAVNKTKLDVEANRESFQETFFNYKTFYEALVTHESFEHKNFVFLKVPEHVAAFIINHPAPSSNSSSSSAQWFTLISEASPAWCESIETAAVLSGIEDFSSVKNNDFENFISKFKTASLLENN